MGPSAEQKVILLESFNRAHRAVELFLHSARKLPPFDPAFLSSPEAMEPYDALAGRFERVVEAVIHPFLKSVELLEAGAVSESVRDRLNYAAKLGLLENPELWMEMRAARNRIAHDYLPERVKAIHDLLLTTYRGEFEKCLLRFKGYISRVKERP